jgi:hypothetical protein
VTGCSALVDLDGLRGVSTGADAGVAITGKAIRCGSTTCDTTSSVCCDECIEDDAGLCTPFFHCIDAKTASTCAAASGDYEFACSDPASCSAGQVCCGLLSTDGYASYIGSQCMSASQCDATSPSIRLCDPDLDASAQCPSGKTCAKDSNVVPAQGIFVCK